MTTNVVVLGAGYAGLVTAHRLARQVHPHEVRVRLVTAMPTFAERPRLHQVATGGRVPDLDLSALLSGTGAELVVGTVTGIDLDRSEVLLEHERVSYDMLVYALGSGIDMDAVPGIREHAHALADRDAAARLRAAAAAIAEQHGTLAVCGGGLTGIETAAEFAEATGVRVRLVTRGEPGDWLSPPGRRYLRRALDRLGVEVIGGAEIVEVGERALALAGGSEVGFDLCVWAGGFTVPALAAQSGLAVNAHGRVLVDQRLRSTSHPEVYAIGDAAAAAGRWGDSIAYGCRTGGFMGPYAADAIAESLAGRRPRPFRFRYLHQCISLGRRDALVQFVHQRDERPLRFVLTGWLATRYKEATLAGAVWLFRHPGPYLRRRRRSGVAHRTGMATPAG